MRPHFEEATLDDLMRRSIELLLQEGEVVEPTKGSTRELFGCVLELSNPRARLSRSAARGRIFSALGELCWYLSGADSVEPIEYYIRRYREFAEPSGVVNGAYGARLFNFNGVDQVAGVIDRLRANPHSRKAVIQLFDRRDVQELYSDVPCTCCVQFLIREGSLQMIAYMRSNDVYLGMPHDFFAFTMLQEIVARTLNVDVGSYIHMVGSLHLYEKDRDAAKRFLDEGWHSSEPVMPPMPDGDPWLSIQNLLNIERSLRSGDIPSAHEVRPSSPYWADLAILLEAFACKDDPCALQSMLARFDCTAFQPYLRERLDRLRRRSH
jgi:thymidylate synthase